MKDCESWSELSINDSFSITILDRVDDDDEKTYGKIFFDNVEDKDITHFPYSDGENLQ